MDCATCVLGLGSFSALHAADPVKINNPKTKPWGYAARENQNDLIVTLVDREGHKTTKNFPAPSPEVEDKIIHAPFHGADWHEASTKALRQYTDFFRFRFDIPAGGYAIVELDPKQSGRAMGKFAIAADLIPVDWEGNRELNTLEDGHGHGPGVASYSAGLAYRVFFDEPRKDGNCGVIGGAPGETFNKLYTRDKAHPDEITLQAESFSQLGAKTLKFEGFPQLPAGPKPFWWTQDLQDAHDRNQAAPGVETKAKP